MGQTSRDISKRNMGQSFRDGGSSPLPPRLTVLGLRMFFPLKRKLLNLISVAIEIRLLLIILRILSVTSDVYLYKHYGFMDRSQRCSLSSHL